MSFLKLESGGYSSSSQSGTAGLSVSGSGYTSTTGYKPVYVQLGCGPSCPGSSGSVVLTSANAPYNTFAYCNGETQVTVNGVQSGCTGSYGSTNVGYIDGLNFVAVS